MAHYTASLVWQRGDQPFLDNRYSRVHTLHFDGGATLQGSSSPSVVRVPMSDPSAVDPEELFVAALSSCHMLWFLSIAVQGKFCVDRYDDEASGVMEKDATGKMVMSVVTLKPTVAFVGSALPTSAEIEAMHHAAHAECFIANSVKTEVRCEPIIP
jgi:organic hydroperoxide reductase OsmC/OhrA